MVAGVPETIMAYHPIKGFPSVFASMVLLATVGCSECVSSPREPLRDGSELAISSRLRGMEDGGLPPGEGWEFPVLNVRWLEQIGTKDFDNRYPSTVLIEGDDPRVEMSCSGVLLHPRLVLTAGHCVCAWRKTASTGSGAGTLIDASACAKHVQVTAIRYEPGEEPSEPALWIREYKGKVRPHPELEIRLDAQGAVVTSRANLAVILLDEPVKPSLPEVSLSESEAQVNDRLVMAGYGVDKDLGGIFGIRYFKQGKVKKVLDSMGGRVLYEAEGAYLNSGFGGGPCFHESQRERGLIGIVGLGEGKDLSFTSTALFRDWLRAELQHATAAGSEAPATP